MLTFKDVIPSPSILMGVKAVWGRSTEPIMCFGTGGVTKTEHKKFYSQARRTAEKALTQPYFLTIGGGSQVPGELSGRVIELVRATGVYGDTQAMVADPILKAKLEQWPVSVMLSEVYAIEGEPHLVDDLGLPDRRVLENAFDSVKSDDERILDLWNVLADRPILRRNDIVLPHGFRDPGVARLIGTLYPKVDVSSPEGKRILKLSIEIERSSALKKSAKQYNKSKNNGVLVCEACDFTDELSSMFDVHHLNPLAAGTRETRLDDLAVLCPTCHRWAHAKGADKLSPLSITELRTVFRGI